MDDHLDMGDHIIPENHERQNLFLVHGPLFCFVCFLAGIFASYSVALAQPWILVAAIL